ncbi:MAG: hypothetical protein KA059_03605 [Elusimicrobiales bacterium]|nr:hypothetical protein [Elusimicrobiales bacterium]
MPIILKYRIKSFFNKVKNFNRWERIKNFIFTLTGIILLFLLYLSFFRILKYLKGVELIGGLLISKLSAMVFVISFFMIVVSSLIISMTTLFYSYDLKFLFSLPLKETEIFSDKVLNTVFYSSWSLMLIILPYVVALMRTNNYSIDFIGIFFLLSIPYAFLAAIIGLFFSLLLMYFFPNSKTRDFIWILSSLSFALAYVGLRFSKPEKLLRPDMMGVIANYLTYLQAPTAPYLPSWWLTKGMIAYGNSNWHSFFINLLLLYAISTILYLLIIKTSQKTYLKAFSGAQSGSNKKYLYRIPFEFKISPKIKSLKKIMPFMYKDRITIKRDVRYYSQIILIAALSMVYVFSIRSLPLNDSDVKNFVSFLNIIVVGFVISAVALRFVFTSVSSEGGAVWIVKTIPVKVENFLFSKLIFYFFPIFILTMILVIVSNLYLEVDTFMFELSVFASTIISFVLCLFAISFGAIFPDFNIENIHQVESSYGGFIYMAVSAVYCVMSASLFSYPVRNYFYMIHNTNYHFEQRAFYAASLLFIIISFSFSYWLFKRAVKSFEKIEV